MKARNPTKRANSQFRVRLYFLMLGVILGVSLTAGLAMVDPDGRDRSSVLHNLRTYLSEDPLIGERVVDPSGGTLGAINDVIIDTHEGRLVYALVSPEGYMGSGDEVIPVSWSLLTRNHRTREFVLNTTAEDLKMAPRFQKDKSPELDDPCWDGDYQRLDDMANGEDQAGFDDIQ